MFMLALVITIIIVDALFRPHLTIMSSTIYMYRSVHKKNPIKSQVLEGITDRYEEEGRKERI
jgi:tRNA uridine 5-carbamoylmethylation protein Kti12